MPLFDRRIEVLIGQGSVKNFTQDLRVQFDILKSNNQVANSASISIYNLSETNRNQIKELDDQVLVKAGYAQDAGPKLLYIGNILRVNHTYSYPDVITKIEAGDGIKATREARGVFSFEEKTKASTVLNEVAAKLGIDIQEIPAALSGEYLQGFSYVGSIKEALTKVCDRLDLEWSVQNNKLQIIEKDSSSKAPVVRVTQVQGLLQKIERVGDIKKVLVKNAKQESPIYKFKSLLIPDIIPGGLVTFEGNQYSGTYKVEKVQHQGDNFEGDFISTCEVKPVGG